MLLRDATDFQTPIPFRVKVCVTNFTGVNNSLNLYIWTTVGYAPSPISTQQPQTRQLSLGECAEIDQPAAIIVQDATTSGTASGYYRLFERTPPAPTFVEATTSAPDGGRARHGSHISLTPLADTRIPCNPISDKSWQNTNFYGAFCHAAFPYQVGVAPNQQAFRICTGKQYVESMNNIYNNVYAASLLDLIINKSSLFYAKPSPYDYNYSPITPQACHDVFNTSEVWFMVGPGNHGGYWDAAKVANIDVTVYRITWDADAGPKGP